MYRKEIAPCGLDCINCDFYQGKNIQVLQMVSKATGKSVDHLQCKGCREQNGCPIHAECKTLECIQRKKHNYCYECEEFPCTFLMPTADQAAKLPHNLKIYNLCFIKRLGENEFLKQSSEIRKKYFQGTMVLGEGPAVKQ